MKEAGRATVVLAGLALATGLASIFATRVLREFSLAEGLAVGAFLFGIALPLVGRGEPDRPRVPWPYRLIITASAVGLGGLLLKGVFVLFGIGDETHDMADHSTAPGNPLLVHIHHLFFNIGFVLFLVAAIGLLARKIRTPGDG